MTLRVKKMAGDKDRKAHSRKNGASSQETPHFSFSLRRGLIGITIFICMAAMIIFIAKFSQLLAPQANLNSSSTFYSNRPDQAFNTIQAAQTDARTFFIGDTVLMPNGLELKVTFVQRNWQPPIAVNSSYGNASDGDNPAGREIIAVWFHAVNVGPSPIGYNDSMFTLQVVGHTEQRMAHLSSLLPVSYGDRGVEPWLLPNQSKDTFVPFLVTLDATLQSFQYYIPPATATAKLTRLAFLLQTPLSHTPAQFVYKANKTITVGQ